MLQQKHRWNIPVKFWFSTQNIRENCNLLKIRFLRQLLGIYTLDKKYRYPQQLRVSNQVEDIQDYLLQWLQYLHRMESTRLLKMVFQYQPTGKGKTKTTMNWSRTISWKYQKQDLHVHDYKEYYFNQPYLPWKMS